MTKIEAMIEVLNGDFKVKAKSPLGNFITLAHTGTLTWNHKVELVTCDNLHAKGYEIVEDKLGLRIFHGEKAKEVADVNTSSTVGVPTDGIK